jgi:hypothetical protein
LELLTQIDVGEHEGVADALVAELIGVPFAVSAAAGCARVLDGGADRCGLGMLVGAMKNWVPMEGME